MPNLRHARGLEATMEPGDVLWLPCYYWHHIRQADTGLNLSVNFWGGGGPGDWRCDRYERVEGARQREGNQMPSVEAAMECAVEAATYHRKRVRHDAAVGAKKANEVAAGMASTMGAADAADAAADAALLDIDDDGGVLALLLSMRVEIVAATHFRDDEKARETRMPTGGPFLEALACGQDAHAHAASARGQPCAWPLDTNASLALAVQMRMQLIATLGSSARANALLRLMTSAGRLSIGKAPALRGPRVNSERGQSTPEREVARLLAVEREGEWGNCPWL